LFIFLVWLEYATGLLSCQNLGVLITSTLSIGLSLELGWLNHFLDLGGNFRHLGHVLIVLGKVSIVSLEPFRFELVGFFATHHSDFGPLFTNLVNLDLVGSSVIFRDASREGSAGAASRERSDACSTPKKSRKKNNETTRENESQGEIRFD
jgi:hypothetical protein